MAADDRFEMASCAGQVLRAFDELDMETLDLHALLEMAGGAAPEMRAEVLDAVEQLERAGLLRPAGGDFYARSERGRLAVAGPLDVTLYTRPECHLCEEAKTAMQSALREFGARLREVNIETDAELVNQFGNDVPVVFLGSKKVVKHRVDGKQFRRQLAAAAGSSRDRR